MDIVFGMLPAAHEAMLQARSLQDAIAEQALLPFALHVKSGVDLGGG